MSDYSGILMADKSRVLMQTLFDVTAERDQLLKENDKLNVQLLSDVTLSDWAVEHLKMIDQLRAEVVKGNTLIEEFERKWYLAMDEAEQLRAELAKAKKEVALDCALMAENDYSAADVAVEIREKYLKEVD